MIQRLKQKRLPSHNPAVPKQLKPNKDVRLLKDNENDFIAKNGQKV